MVAWMAGMFYLPRLFVYHCDLQPGSAESERFKVMEYRLMKQIINPAMMATWTFGALLVLTPGVIDWSWGWWHVKLACVILMAGFHGAMSKWRRDFLEDRNTIRQEARKALETMLLEEARIDAAARAKIASQRKIILEGSQEWEILYRKYYNDEVRKLGI